MMPLLWSTSYDGVLIDATKIVFKGTGTWGAQSTRTIYFVIQYTKTTDSAISIGSDTDYSTDEKVIGTWIDGKPVYQKTYNEKVTTYTDNGYRRMFISSTIPNVETIVNCNNVYLDGSYNNGWYGSTFASSNTAQGCVLQRNVFAIVNSESHELSVRHQSNAGDGLTSVTFLCTVQYTKTT
jgi:hypothetical protein